MAMSNVGFWITAVVLSMVCVNADYWEDRKAFLKEEEQLFMGATNQLTAEEEFVNSILMEAKKREFSTYFDNQLFPPARHFFFAKPDIQRSEVFSTLQKLPKGGLLHAHDTGTVSLDFLIGNLTYWSPLYACVNLSQDNLEVSFLVGFIFSSNQPNSSTECQWMLMENFRQKFGNEAVDQWLRRELSLLTSNPREKYPNVNVVWEYFNQMFVKVNGLITYLPVFRACYVQILKELLQDKVMYLELRGTLPQLYDLEGKVYEGADVLSLYKEATDEFKNQNADFFDAKYIYAPVRFVNNATFAEYIAMVRELNKMFPDFLAGFDLVGQEDKGRPLSDFVDGILSLPSNIKFFFHAGETDWQGITDLNLVDAILLNTTRIGHGYALPKHPSVMKWVKERGIGIEVNPISNQVLALVDDLRNHPAAGLIADNFPVVIASDDPTYWDAVGLSYDFYEAFMGLAGKDADLRFLKQLSMNSIIYSGMSGSEVTRAIDVWLSQWNQFIRQIISENRYGSQHFKTQNSVLIV